ncbi:MAG TPA: (2Fe-2S)-binding protein [Xanthobacteraceae bacterium]|nr:(2Fe-2S)-binding protein [Xanthobacteraceae bacterium]
MVEEPRRDRAPDSGASSTNASSTNKSSTNALTIKVNGRVAEVEAPPGTPLLYVLTNDLELRGPKFGCGLAQCGACSVLLDGVEIRSCITPVASVVGKSITTLEGLANWHAEQKRLPQAPALHPLQQALIEVQAPHCGYCVSGMVVKASELLARNERPSDAEIRQHMNGHLCRCGTYPRLMQAIKLASRTMAGETP